MSTRTQTRREAKALEASRRSKTQATVAAVAAGIAIGFAAGVLLAAKTAGGPGPKA